MNFLSSLRDSEFGQQFLRFVPAGAGAAWAKWTLSDTVAMCTIVYIALQAAYLARKWYREEKLARRRRGKA